jgi:hypothetical protein
MERTMMDDVNVACETMSLAELNELYTKVGRLIDEKSARRRDELTNEFIAAFRALRKEFPEVRMPTEITEYCDGCECTVEFGVDILELLEDKYGLGY